MKRKYPPLQLLFKLLIATLMKPASQQVALSFLNGELTLGMIMKEFPIGSDSSYFIFYDRMCKKINTWGDVVDVIRAGDFKTLGDLHVS